MEFPILAAGASEDQRQGEKKIDTRKSDPDLEGHLDGFVHGCPQLPAR
jgi:hypothetical protein